VKPIIRVDSPSSTASYNSPAAFINSLVNFVRSLVCMTVGRLVQPISVGRRSLPGSSSSANATSSHLFVKALNSRNLRNQYSMKSLRTVPVVPSAMISKKLAHSPQLNPSDRADFLCSGFVRLLFARRAIRASATCWMVISSVLKKEAVSFHTVSLNGSGSAKKRSERLYPSVQYPTFNRPRQHQEERQIEHLPQTEIMLQHALASQGIEVKSPRKRLRVRTHRLRK
jgi:hypothetical protein